MRWMVRQRGEGDEVDCLSERQIRLMIREMEMKWMASQRDEEDEMDGQSER
jgi:hypothetical protein